MYLRASRTTYRIFMPGSMPVPLLRYASTAAPSTQRWAYVRRLVRGFRTGAGTAADPGDGVKIPGFRVPPRVLRRIRKFTNFRVPPNVLWQIRKSWTSGFQNFKFPAVECPHKMR